MKPVDTILEVAAHYQTYGVSYLYNSILGNLIERKTAVYVRDGEGNLITVIFGSAASMKEALR
jgi:hypothetical protein